MSKREHYLGYDMTICGQGHAQQNEEHSLVAGVHAGREVVVVCFELCSEDKANVKVWTRTGRTALLIARFKGTSFFGKILISQIN